MQRISQSLTGNHALSWLLKMPSIKKKMPSLSTNQRSVILPFIDNGSNSGMQSKTNQIYELMLTFDVFYRVVQ